MSAWWAEADQFDRVSAFLRHRGLMGPTRMVMAVVVGSAALIPISAMVPSRHQSALSFVVGVVGATLCAAMTWYWFTRWPTRWVSLCAALLGSACAAAWSVTQPSPAMAALACATLTVTGGYLAFLHNFRCVLVNAALAAGAAVVAAIRLGHDLGVASGLAAFWIMLLPNFALPLGVRCLSNAMTHFAIRSGEDPLTGLLNRRGFGEAVSGRLLDEVRTTPGAHLIVAMIDLDDFKRVNDTHGHAAGDRTLSTVAQLLRARLPAGAVLCRSGGEEFLIATSSPAHDTIDVTAPLCEAIRAECGITASIGVAATGAGDVHASPPGALIDRLIEDADRAMYEAKRGGGNRMHRARQDRSA
ncbi:hypothetical protein MMAD_18470 [Mycolicibacterium madagascariense]|uniref:GGDEF domain-containing protein n=2 Tax=Mycolicibacterium madagascariense TaxID=212765 RepID=A0A7I7XDI9_9MYCO|nr:GGDEF domain-containing protein [Mycolicibacterium madagascariense]BBZ27552.1 hypothetical protein MMAD_18470 [Mycolicibacterium madagascariense]